MVRSFTHMRLGISDRNKMVLWPGCGGRAEFSLHTKNVRSVWFVVKRRGCCCNLSGSVALIVWFTTNGMCAKNKIICTWREQAIIEWSRRVILIVACYHGAKLCAHAARDFDRNTVYGVISAPQCGPIRDDRIVIFYYPILSCFWKIISVFDPNPVLVEIILSLSENYPKVYYDQDVEAAILSTASASTPIASASASTNKRRKNDRWP